MDRLDEILAFYVADADDKDMVNKIPGAAFVVVDKNGNTTSSSSHPHMLITPHPHVLSY